MRYILLLFALAFTGLIACKQNTQAPVKQVTEDDFKKQSERDVQHVTVNQNNDALKNNMQGKWKSEKEAGATYEVTADKITRFVNGKTDYTGDVVFSADCGIQCGQVSKKYAREGKAGCMTVTTKTQSCLWVLTTTADKVVFLKMDSSDTEPETWTKM
jgi:hypothetical protein